MTHRTPHLLIGFDGSPSAATAVRVAAAAATTETGVVALGSRGLGAARSVLVGSVSSGLVQNAELPVLVVPD